MQKMLINNLRKKLKQGKLTIGGWIQICDPSIAEIMSNANYDWITFDLEHGSYSIKDLINSVRAVELNKKLKLARLPNKNLDISAQVLDAGCDGIIIPNIKNKSELLKIRDSLYYPPAGQRGVGFSRANVFGKNFKRVIKNKIKPILIAMIENIEGIKNLDEILSVQGLDAILVGPYDLSSSLKITGQFNHPRFKKAIKQIIDKTKKKKITLGIHVLQTSIKEVKAQFRKGFKFIPYGTDALLLNKSIINSFKL